MSLVQTPAANPKSLSCALEIASASSLKVAMLSTGPKISSCTAAEEFGRSMKAVGGTKKPLAKSAPVGTLAEAITLPPSFLAISM